MSPIPSAKPVARLRYTKSSGRWAIYWRNRTLKFHEYNHKHKRPTTNVQSLLDWIVNGDDPIDLLGLRRGSEALRAICSGPQTVRATLHR